MDKMRADMGGAACVVATILAASSLKMKINVKGIHPRSFHMSVYILIILTYEIS